MTDLAVRVTAVRWDGENFPGWLDVTVTDATGQVHRIVEKAPVVRLAHGVETTDGVQELAMSTADVRRFVGPARSPRVSP